MRTNSSISLRSKFLSVPLMFILGTGGLLLAFSWQGSKNQKYNAAINLSGRQRMLNQRHTSEILRVGIGEAVDYMGTRRLLESSLRLLSEGGVHKFGAIAEAKDERLQAAIRQNEECLSRSFAVADRYLEVSTRGESSKEDLSSARRKLVEQTAETHKHAHAMVNLIATIAQEDSRKATNIAFALGVLTAIACSAWAFQVGSHAMKEIGSKAQMFANLSKSDLRKVSDNLRANSEDTSEKAQLTSCAATQLSASAQSLSRTVGHFEASIKEIAGNASAAVNIAGNAVEATQKTSLTISRLGESSTQIGNVIKVINSIAEQTNLLALNATIEAARAGDAGKGFAVVANEVKELAKETSKATEDIIDRINAIQSDTTEAIDAIEHVNQIISEINDSQNAIAGAVEQQSSMTSDISHGIGEVATGSTEIAGNISRVAESAQSAAESSNATRDTANQIEHAVEDLLHFVG